MGRPYGWLPLFWRDPVSSAIHDLIVLRTGSIYLGGSSGLNLVSSLHSRPVAQGCPELRKVDLRGLDVADDVVKALKEEHGVVCLVDETPSEGPHPRSGVRDSGRDSRERGRGDDPGGCAPEGTPQKKSRGACKHVHKTV
jgi:hypothetical protein